MPSPIEKNNGLQGDYVGELANSNEYKTQKICNQL
jgi:hypothetical protein